MACDGDDDVIMTGGRVNRREILCCGAAILLSGSVQASAAGRRPPNYIVICCDDLGYGDIGPNGGKAIPTPHLDRMAREGITLTDYYAPANVCTPSRAGLLTGRYPIRTGLSNVLSADDTGGLPATEVTIAGALKPLYTSALVGKWHLGHTGERWSPTYHGFDLFYGIPYSHDMLPLQVYEFDRSGKVAQSDPDYPRLQQNFYARAERFIEDNRARPFFLELALSSPHLANFPAPGFAGKSKAAGAYGDTVIEIDAIVGRLLARLKALGIDRDTMVILTSDNGPWFEGSTGGLRQRKGGAGFDGGYRVPFVARWPGQIPANVRSNAIAMGIDLLPTLCSLSGIAPPRDVKLDGKDIAGVLTRRGASPHDELVLFQRDEVVGIRTQKWKYVNSDFYMTSLILLEGRGYPQLYDMADPSEQYSVASLHPEILRAMKSRLARATAEFAPLRAPGKSSLDTQRERKSKRSLPAQWRDGEPAD